MGLRASVVLGRSLLALGCALGISACEGGPPTDALSQRLLDRYELNAAGATTTHRIEVGEFEQDGLPWVAYLNASRAIDLDFSPRPDRFHGHRHRRPGRQVEDRLPVLLHGDHRPALAGQPVVPHPAVRAGLGPQLDAAA